MTYIPSPLLDQGRFQTMPADQQGWTAVMRELGGLVPDHITAEVSTSNNSPTEIAFVDLEENSAKLIIAYVVAKEPGTTNASAFGTAALWYRNAGEAAGQEVASPADWFADISTVGWGGLSTVRGSPNNRVSLRVQGANATTVKWRAHIWTLEVRD